MTICRWYLLCENWAVGEVTHPVIGDVPVCQRCAERHDLDLRPYDGDEAVSERG